MSRNNLEHFVTLLDQYKQVAFPNHVDQELKTAAVLDLFETVDYVKSVPDQQVIDILVTGCKALGHQNALSRSFCRFMFKQLSKQVRVTGFRPAQFDICVKYLMDGLDLVHGDNDYKVDLLRALGALVFENASNTQRCAPRLSKTLLRFADKSTKPLEVRRMAINCIGNTCAEAGPKLQSLYKDFYACLLGNVCTIDHTKQGTIMVASKSLDFTDTGVRKVASSTLRSLQFLLAQDKSLVTNPLCDIVEIIYTFIFMNVSVQSYSSISSSNTSTTAGIGRKNRLSNPTPSKPLQFAWRTPLNHQKAEVTSSESELSDSHSANNELSPRRQRDNAKIRINALLCLSAIANTSPKALHPRWYKFFPDTFSIFLANNSSDDALAPALRSDNQPYSLFTVLLYDPFVTVRAAVCNTIISMLDGSKQYLSLALESEKSKSSFTSLSENLGSMIRDIHRGLVYALRKEQTNQILNMLMNVVSILVDNCSYERLSKEHLPSLYHVVVQHWKEPALRGSILKALNSIFSVHQQNLESLQEDLIDRILVEAIADTTEEIQTEGWRTCTVLTKTFFSESLWDKLKDHFKPSAASFKFAEAYASAIGSKDKIQQSDVMWWQTMMEKYLQQACSDEVAAVRAAACDCFASMSKDIFEQYHYRYQRLAVTLLFSLSADSDSSVRAAACRALGVFVLFPSLREDPMFVSDMTKAILLQKEEKTILVRVRASWAIGNLCDALVLESEKPEFSLREFMSTTEWIEVLSTATSGSLDNDKLRSNAVRAIGSLLRVTPKEYYENTRIMSLIRNAMDGLVKNIESGSLKTRWNACHATSNMLTNVHFPIGFVKGIGGIYPWTHTLYQALVQSLLDCKNFKVRINACLAMTTPTKEDQYGDKLPVIIKSILDAWEICQQSVDYNEIKYKKQLEQQICDSLYRIKDWIPLCYKEQVNAILLSHVSLKAEE